MQAFSTTAADAVERIFTLVLQNEQHNALQDAKTFSNLLCVNQQLRQALLASAVGRITLSLPSHRAWGHHRSMIMWVQQHLRLHTLKEVQVLHDLLDRPMGDVHQVLADVVERVDSPLCPAINSRFAAVHRLACVLGDAAAGSHAPDKLPVLSRWYGHDLPAATLSLLPGNPITQLCLTTVNYYNPTLQELSALTNLQELRLPGLRPAPAQLAYVLTALTSLTGLLLVEPDEDLVQALPVCVQELVWVRGAESKDTMPVDHVDLRHMTNLKTLHLVGADTLDVDVFEDLEFADYEAHWGWLKLRDVLPSSLRWLSVDGVVDCYALRPLQQLKHLRIFWGDPGIGCGAAGDLTRFTSLTRVELLQPKEGAVALCDVASWSRLCDKLPLHVPSLDVEVPTDIRQSHHDGVGAFGEPVSFSALGAFTSLTRLVLRRRRARRAAAILTAAAAAGGNGVGAGAWLGSVQELTGALAKLTNLRELQLNQVPAVVEAGAGAVGPDWLPVMQAAAGLPSLEELSFEAMPLGASVSALSSARSLTSLSLINCQVDDVGMVGMVTGMQCSLQDLTLARPRGLAEGGPRLGEAVLVALVQHLSQLTRLYLRGPVFAPGAVTSFCDLGLRGVVVGDTRLLEEA